MKKRSLMLIPILVAGIPLTVFAATVKPYGSVDPKGPDFGNSVTEIGFCLEDVTDTGINAEIYERLRYDIAEIGMLAVGDVIETDDGAVTVETKEEKNGLLVINGGFEEDGISFYTEEETNGWFLGVPGYPVYQQKGQAQLLFSDSVRLLVYDMDDAGCMISDGFTETECTPQEVKEKLSQLSEILTDVFSPNQVLALQEEGKLTELTIRYVP